MKRKIVKSALDFIKDVASEVLNDKNRLAKAIAVHIRNGIEDFHWKYLSDEDMHELNPRKGMQYIRSLWTSRKIFVAYLLSVIHMGVLIILPINKQAY